MTKEYDKHLDELTLTLRKVLALVDDTDLTGMSLETLSDGYRVLQKYERHHEIRKMIYDPEFQGVLVDGKFHSREDCLGPGEEGLLAQYLEEGRLTPLKTWNKKEKDS